jgi:5-formyltetrahydrofolate cyclo-ligase
VLPGALGPRKPWGQRFSVRELSLPGPWSRYYGAHLRVQATEESRYRRPWRARASRLESKRDLSTVKNLVQRKAALRAEQRRRRRAVAPGAGGAAEALADRLIATFRLPEGVIVSGCGRLADELDPRPAMRRRAAFRHPFALPRMQGRGRALAGHAWRRGDPLRAGRFGVMEPAAEAPLARPRVLLVSLAAFDRRGRGLGYGAGYYDLVLGELRALCPGPLAIGLAYAAQEVDEVPAGPGDQLLGAVVTEGAVPRCSEINGAAPTGLRTGRG